MTFTKIHLEFLQNNFDELSKKVLLFPIIFRAGGYVKIFKSQKDIIDVMEKIKNEIS